MGRILLNKNALKPSIQECFDRGGTLILALVGCDSPGAEEKALENIKKKIGEKYKDAKIEIWTMSTLRGFLAGNPYLRLQVLSIDDSSFKLYEVWRKQDDMDKAVNLGPEQTGFIDAVRRYLDRPSGKHLRIVAEPGIGKTRLVLEALGAKQYSTACIYVDRPSAFTNSRSFRHILDDGCSADIFLVIDECDEETMLEIWNRVKRLPRIRLVTIYNEPGTRMGSMEQLQVPSLDDGQIMSILESYEVPSHHRAKYCGICGSSPRAAHAIGSSLKHNLGDIRGIHEDRVWDLYIGSKTRRDSEEFKTRKTILLWISAFRRIGFTGYYTKEYGILQKLLAERENISLGTFTGTVKKLREMRILQGDATLYITPKILHLHLWLEWHEQYHNIEPTLPDYRPEDISKFSPEANMLEWRTDMFSYAKDVHTDHHIQNLFAEDGYVDTHRLLESEFGAELFYSLAKADIDRAVDYIYRRISYHTGLYHSRFKLGQRWMAITLLGASMKRGLFEKSARLLLSLAASDNGDLEVAEIFTSLFVPKYGQYSQTEMPPSERLPLIRDELFSVDQKRRRLAIQACDAALTGPAFTYAYGQEELWHDPTPWMPKSETEIPEFYKEVLEILHSHMEYVQSEEEETSVVEVILKNGVGMLADPTVSGKVVDIVMDLYKERHVGAETIIGAISSHTAQSIFRPMAESFLMEAGRLQDLLIGSDYHLMMRQTVAWKMAHDPRGRSTRSIG